MIFSTSPLPTASRACAVAVGSGDVLKIIGAYLADVTSAETGPEPRHFREEFRRTGPSNYFHGKQESAENV